jgi:D-glycero-D-manno-heptose 1,7-bisphosphate phosphatase
VGVGDGARTDVVADWAVFLDRDGLINELVEDSVSGLPESPSRPEDVRLAPDAVEAVRKLRGLGVPLIVASNQPNAAKGKNTLEELEAVHEAVVRLLDAAGVALDDYRYCYHHPDGTDPELGRACSCRKPDPGLILEAADGLDLARSWVVGDSDVDIEAGQAVGCRTILVEVPGSAHRRKGNVNPDYRVPNFGKAADIIASLCSTN